MFARTPPSQGKKGGGSIENRGEGNTFYLRKWGTLLGRGQSHGKEKIGKKRKAIVDLATKRGSHPVTLPRRKRGKKSLHFSMVTSMSKS